MDLPIIIGVIALTLCRSNSPIGILSIELPASLDGKVFTLPSNTACISMESIPIGLLDRQKVKPQSYDLALAKWFRRS